MTNQEWEHEEKIKFEFDLAAERKDEYAAKTSQDDQEAEEKARDVYHHRP